MPYRQHLYTKVIIIHQSTNSKYIRFKGLDNSRLHVAGRDNRIAYTYDTRWRAYSCQSPSSCHHMGKIPS